ncbi:MAG: hypothetical protein RL154_554 [Pseudomonadota bacterium]|jgi:glutamate synthase (NADPH/NADH) small chain
MQNFLKVDRVEQNKKPVLARIKNFQEIYEQFDAPSAKTQSSRCVQCGIPYCSYGCPLSNFVPHWLKAIAEQDLKLAFELSNQSSPFPEIMGRVCPQDRLCEGSCTLNDAFGAITIGSIETFITENGFKHGLTVKFSDAVSVKRVAVIGAGPAGLSVATFLLRAGISVDLFEKEAFAGGLLTWGIPDFKLNKKTVLNRVNLLKSAGLNLILNCEIGKDISFEKLREDFDAIFISIGAKKSNSAHVVGETADNVYQAIDFLGMSQSSKITLPNHKPVDIKGKTVIVIGGGDTAMDCARTAIRDGAARTICAYRRNAENMPGSKKEYKNAIEEGVEFSFFVSPKSLKLGPNGEVIGVVFTQTQVVKTPDAPRGKLEEVPNSEQFIKADIVVFALGFDVKIPDFITKAGVELNKYGQIIVDKNGKTTAPNIYAGGDCVRGANLVVNAALDGREAAKAIVKSLED